MYFLSLLQKSVDLWYEFLTFLSKLKHLIAWKLPENDHFLLILPAFKHRENTNMFLEKKSLDRKEWGNFGFVPYQFLKLACQFCFSNNGQAAYNSEFILTLGFNSILWSFYNSQWLKKETYTKFCKKWLKRNIAKNGSHDIVKL